MRNCRRTLGRRPSQKIGHAGDDANVRLGSDLAQRGDEDPQVSAGQRLAVLQERIRTATVLVNVVPDVGVPDQGEETGLRHYPL